MTRDAGFAHADIDVSLLDDPKFRQLVRSARDEGIVARCVVAYTTTVLASWERGERVTLEDAAPLWLTGLDDLAERLANVGLLDSDGRIPPEPWRAWFVAAANRREAGRDRWRRWKDRQQRGRTQSDSPTGQTDRQAVRQADPTSDKRMSNVGNRDTSGTKGERTNGAAIVPSEGPCRICGGHVTDAQTGTRVGPGWIEHGEHPEDLEATA